MTYFLNGSLFNFFYSHIILYCEKVTSYEKISYSLTLEVRILLRLWDKRFLSDIYTEIYRHLHSKCFKNSGLGRQEMVQCKCFFWHKTEICLLKNLQSETWQRLLAVLHEHIIFNVKWIEARKMSEVFWAKLYCEMSDLFTSFCWLCDVCLK